MLHPDTELKFVNPIIGYGIFATRIIPKGTVTWVRDDLDQTFTLDQVRSMAQLYQAVIDKYSFIDAKGQAVLCWDLARFMNHSCEANCMGAGYEFEVATRDILPGEELTDDYGTLNLQEPFVCACGSAHCRRRIHPDDLLRHAEDWDQKLRAAFLRIPDVKQPLWPLLSNREEIEAAVLDPRKMRSSRQNFCGVMI